MACSAARRRNDEPWVRPTMTVVAWPVDPASSVSQIVQADSSSDSGGPRSCGAPGMPSSGPRLVRANSDSATGFGLAAVAVISRAEARFSTGCQISPTRTYSAPDSLPITIRAWSSPACGLSRASNAHAATATAASMHPSVNDAVCARLRSPAAGSPSNAHSTRRSRNR